MIFLDHVCGLLFWGSKTINSSLFTKIPVKLINLYREQWLCVLALCPLVGVTKRDSAVIFWNLFITRKWYKAFACFFSLSFHSGKKKSPVFHFVVGFFLFFFSLFLELQRGAYTLHKYILFSCCRLKDKKKVLSVLGVGAGCCSGPRKKIQTKKSQKRRTFSRLKQCLRKWSDKQVDRFFNA